MDSQTTQAIGKLENYVPPKMWKDLTDAERIVRMREEIKNKDWVINNLQQRVSAIESLVKNHTHLDSGDVVQKVNNLGGMLGASIGGSALKSASGNPDNVYF